MTSTAARARPTSRQTPAARGRRRPTELRPALQPAGQRLHVLAGRPGACGVGRPRPTAACWAGASAGSSSRERSCTQPGRHHHPVALLAERHLWRGAAAGRRRAGRPAPASEMRDRSICCARASVSRCSNGPLNPSSVRNGVRPSPAPSSVRPIARIRDAGVHGPVRAQSAGRGTSTKPQRRPAVAQLGDRRRAAFRRR